MLDAQLLVNGLHDLFGQLLVLRFKFNPIVWARDRVKESFLRARNEVQNTFLQNVRFVNKRQNETAKQIVFRERFDETFRTLNLKDVIDNI